MKLLRATALLGAAAAAGYLARPQLDLHDKVAIVTGGSRGLGLAIAERLVSGGAKVVICARDSAALAVAQRHLGSLGGSVLAVTCDVSDEHQTKQLVQRCLETFGAIDILVNNAGTIQVGPLHSLGVGKFREAMESMFWGTVNTTLAVLPHMRQQGKGHIVNITSIGGKISVPHLMPYGSAKFAAVGFSEGLHAEVARDGVKVTTVVPGLMRTGSDVQAEFAGDARREFAWFSVAAATPGLSMDAGKAAQRIVNALRRGRSEVVLTVPAKAAVLVHGLAPGLTQQALALVNRLLPGSAGVAGQTVRGEQLAAHAGKTVRTLTELNRGAGERLNQPTP